MRVSVNEQILEKYKNVELKVKLFQTDPMSTARINVKTGIAGCMAAA